MITAADLGRVLMVANSAVRRASGGKARILPEMGVAEPAKNWQESEAPRLNLDEIEDVSEFKARLSMSRSRKPLLETITEETICFR